MLKPVRGCEVGKLGDLTVQVFGLVMLQVSAFVGMDEKLGLGVLGF